MKISAGTLSKYLATISDFFDVDDIDLLVETDTEDAEVNLNVYSHAGDGTDKKRVAVIRENGVEGGYILILYDKDK